MRTRMKQQYRSELGIISDILFVTMDCGRQGIIISSISRRTNLSHNSAIEKCQKLIDFGLLTSITNGKNNLFVVTEKGILFFHEMQKFLEIAHELNIRY